MLHQSVITLRVVWDDQENSDPRYWDWQALLDTVDPDHAEVLEGREVPLGMTFTIERNK